MCLNHDGTIIRAVETVRDIGAYFDSEMTMRSHVSKLTRSCFYHLRRLRSIRRNLDRGATQQPESQKNLQTYQKHEINQCYIDWTAIDQSRVHSRRFGDMIAAI